MRHASLLALLLTACGGAHFSGLANPMPDSAAAGSAGAAGAFQDGGPESSADSSPGGSGGFSGARGDSGSVSDAGQDSRPPDASPGPCEAGATRTIGACGGCGSAVETCYAGTWSAPACEHPDCQLGQACKSNLDCASKACGTSSGEQICCVPTGGVYLSDAGKIAGPCCSGYGNQTAGSTCCAGPSPGCVAF